ncbi:MAG: UDP-2,4-diacetamido-2,4,6-trideoxy-beta-L-altropyranose hydrolase [Burkholderiales bacterium]
MDGRHISFRTDAALEIGTGHVMRCLTLADALKAAGAKCRFICREHPGHMLNLIRQRGHEAIGLPQGTSNGLPVSNDHEADLVHAAWLGANWQTDASQTMAVLRDVTTDWLIIDHYALDARWELALKPHYRKLMVIDDLADREHVCHVLLDQNLVEAMAQRYVGKVPSHCTNLIGPKYALLRPEFNALRPASLTRRRIPVLARLLIFMGGSDPTNETAKVIAGVQLSKRQWVHIDVVVGQAFAALQSLQEVLDTVPGATLQVQASDMAQIMAAADLAVTAGGSVTWEKCALGLPSLVVVLGDNQRPIAKMMHQIGAQRTLGVASDITPACYAETLDAIQTHELSAMIDSASAICDGSGTQIVLKILENHA